MAIQYRVDRAFGRDRHSGEPPDQTLSDLTGTPAGVLALDVQNVVFNLKRKLTAKTIGSTTPIREPLNPAFLVAIEDFVAGLAGDSKLPARLAGEPQTAVSRPSPNTPSKASLPPSRGKSVTYVSGTICYLCLGSLTETITCSEIARLRLIL